MKLKGLNQVLKSLEFDANAIEQVLVKAGDNILANTKASASAIDTEIANSFDTLLVKQPDKISVSVYSDLKLSAFSEFGTGGFVVVPPETTDAYTMQWFVNGKGSLRPHPALFPAFRIELPKVIEELKTSLKK